MHLYKLIKNTRQIFKTVCKYDNFKVQGKRKFSSNDKPAVILGIETSCDDTGFAIVDSTGKILGEAHHSQLLHHLPQGGINPAVAKELHIEHIQRVYEECMKSANMDIKDVDAIATTVEPGLPLSLVIGRNFGRDLALANDKPFIPIHHMKAHALMARMVERIDFPFLVLLVSGGHCLLALVESADEFKLLGSTIDSAPGQIFDKIARRLKLINLMEYAEVSGGQAVEMATNKATDVNQFFFPVPIATYRDCNFSFAGLHTIVMRHVEAQEEKFNVMGADIIPDYENICAGFLMITAKHLCVRTERAMEYIDKMELLPPDKKTLVVSGGCASNNFIFKALGKVCEETGYRVTRPPPKLCTDNGVMIAWNGVERYLTDSNILRNKSDIEKVDIAYRSLIGEDWRDLVLKSSIKRKWVKLNFNHLVDRQ